MRIHGHDSPLAERDKVSGSTSTSTAAAASTDAKVQAQALLTGAEAVVVSSGASELAAQGAKDRASHVERVAKVKEAVKSGTYRVDLDRLAQKFIDEELAGPRR